MADKGCVCKGNWRSILKETEHLIDTYFTNEAGEKFVYFGLVHGSDDYYYGFSGPCPSGSVRLLSCVGSIATHGYTPTGERRDWEQLWRELT